MIIQNFLAIINTQIHDKAPQNQNLERKNINTVLPNSHFFTKSFFLPVWTAKKAKNSLKRAF
jgi:hypothetical protein